MKIYTDEEFISMLRKSVEQEGTQSAFANRLGISTAFLHDVLNGRRRPNKKIIEELGLTEIRGFAKK
jgi:predicted transcriptional regulator